MPNNKKNTAPTVETEENVITEEAAEANNNEIIDVEWEDVEHIFEAREQLKEMEMHLARQCVQFEKNKHEILQRISYFENAVYEMATELREKKNVDDSLSYELKLPTNPEEKAYFLLRE